ncbi:MAG: YceD family protein [Burkholderiaceae bacterium]|jgi:uncharacterized protein|nr:YceD family protein [Burkholderiaceae bacterium]
MQKTFQPDRLDVAAFADARGMLEGADSLEKYERLTLSSQADSSVKWQARGERRAAVDGSVRAALRLCIEADLPLTCQRCMGPVMTPVRIDRYFVFVPGETAAAALDEESEDDVLELTAALDLHALIEDELIMAMPLVPRHEQCPEQVRLSTQDAGFDDAGAAPIHPFAALAGLRHRKAD